MKSLAIAHWLSSRLVDRPAQETGEFSQAQMAAWEAAARRGQRAARLAALLHKLSSRPAARPLAFGK